MKNRTALKTVSLGDFIEEIYKDAKKSCHDKPMAKQIAAFLVAKKLRQEVK